MVAEAAHAQEICNNGIDDDGDNLIDWFDPDCNDFGEDCENGVDDDGDGYVDCDDAECNGKIGLPVIGNCGGELNCDNGIDDDNDGFVDYYDSDCLNDPNNPNDYIVVIPGCEAKPVGNVFDMQLAWRSRDGTSYSYGLPAVGDIDNDGIPEIVTANEKGRKLYILEGKFDGPGRNQPVEQVTVSNTDLYSYPTIGDVDGDGDGEIFIMDRGGRIRCYDHNLNLLWGGVPGASPAEFRSCYTSFGSALGLADFNHDGRPELYYGNEIRDAVTGQLLIKGSHGTTLYSLNNWQTELNGAGVAVDILPTIPWFRISIGKYYLFSKYNKY